MKVSLHLISLPWAPVLQPSIALGALSAYVKQYYDNKIKCHSYSAFIEILVEALGDKFIEFCDPKSFGRFSETISQIIYFEEFKKEQINKKHRRDFIRQIKAEEKLFSLSLAQRLRTALINYINRQIVPNLGENSVNIIGFSMCMQQCYFSAFVGKYLQVNYPEFKYIFLYGGFSASSVNVAKIFADEEIPGYFVIGEGEKKLVNIVESIHRIGSLNSEIEEQLLTEIAGVFPIKSRIMQYEKNSRFYDMQVDVSFLPAPDYEEYFETLQKICEDSDAYDEIIKEVQIPLEGTRGCFAKCDFCNNALVWKGFRSLPHKRITANALRYTRKYRCNKVIFVDNSCNTWASKYAEELIARNRHISTFMELRAQNSESFWTKLALSGVRSIQIGTEALSPVLLRSIGKGTTVAQNIITQKYLKELNIRSVSNIMADHPNSTVEDVKITKNVVEHLSHLDQYNITFFVLVQGSPLYSSLSDYDRRKLKIGSTIPCDGLYKKLLISEHFRSPKHWLSPRTKRAWSDFAKWLVKRRQNLLNRPERLDIIQCSGETLWIRKISNDKQKDFKYNGKYAKVYANCHNGRTQDMIMEMAEVGEIEVIDILNEFTSNKLMIEIEGLYISLALRPRDVLIQNYFRSH